MKIPMLYFERAGKKYEMDLSAKTAQVVLAFSDERRMLPVDEFFARHIEILAQIFNAPLKLVDELNAVELVKIYLCCLEYVARNISNIAKGERIKTNGKSKHKRQRN